MPSSTSSSDFVRPIPELPWRGITVIVVLIVMAAAAAWELHVRSIGYSPYPERYRRPLGAGTPSGATRVSGHHW